MLKKKRYIGINYWGEIRGSLTNTYRLNQLIAEQSITDWAICGWCLIDNTREHSDMDLQRTLKTERVKTMR